jgi:hypothetical protein
MCNYGVGIVNISVDYQLDFHEYLFLKTVSKGEVIWHYIRSDNIPLKDWVHYALNVEMSSNAGKPWAMYLQFLKLGIIGCNSRDFFTPTMTALAHSLVKEWESNSTNQARAHDWEIKYEVKDLR